MIAAWRINENTIDLPKKLENKLKYVVRYSLSNCLFLRVHVFHRSLFFVKNYLFSQFKEKIPWKKQKSKRLRVNHTTCLNLFFDFSHKSIVFIAFYMLLSNGVLEV